MNNKIKIDIVSDIVCPWCIIGYKRLEIALNELDIKDQTEITWHPFELNPTMGKNGENFIEYFSKKYKLNKEQVKSFQKDIISQGKDIGFIFDYFEDMRVYNTRDAHILLDFAKIFEKQTQLKLALFNAHFSKRNNISKQDTLLSIVQSIGLDTTLAIKVLENENKIFKIEKEEFDWSRKGINTVPTMIFNDTTTLNGAYPIETYKNLLTEIIEKTKN